MSDATYPGLSLEEVIALVNADLLAPDSDTDDWRDEVGPSSRGFANYDDFINDRRFR